MRRIASVASIFIVSLTMTGVPRAEAKDAFCGPMAKFAKDMNGLDDVDFDKDPKGAGKSFTEAGKRMKDLEGKAPSKYKADVKTVRTGVEQIGKAMAKVNPKDPKSLAAALSILTQAGSEKMTKASDRLEAFAKSCGIKTD